MKEPDRNSPTDVEDLTVKTDQAEEVIGGAHVDYFLKLQGIDGEATSSREPGAPSVSEVVVTKITDCA